MRWPWAWRRRRRSERHDVAVPTHRPGSWASTAYPPRDQSEIAAETVDQPEPKVRLGFADGSSITLDEGSSDVAALRTVAGTLISRQQPGAPD